MVLGAYHSGLPDIYQQVYLIVRLSYEETYLEVVGWEKLGGNLNNQLCMLLKISLKDEGKNMKYTS